MHHESWSKMDVPIFRLKKSTLQYRDKIVFLIFEKIINAVKYSVPGVTEKNKVTLNP